MKLNYETIIRGAISAIRDNQLPMPTAEWKFHPERLWRFDFAWPQEKIALEVEGLTASGGRHQRLAGYEADCEKYNQAALLGWIVLRCSASQLRRDPFRYLEMVAELRHRLVPGAWWVGGYSVMTTTTPPLKRRSKKPAGKVTL